MPNPIKFAYGHSKVFQKLALQLNQEHFGMKYRIFGISADDEEFYKITISYHVFIWREVDDLYILGDN